MSQKRHLSGWDYEIRAIRDARSNTGQRTDPARLLWTGSRRECALSSAGPDPNRSREPMLTKEIFFGMNILTLAGFAVMGLTLTL